MTVARADRPNYAPEIKRALTDVTRVLEALGILGEGRARQKQAGGWIIRCPAHNENTPSCSVQAKSGALLWKCHGCQAGGDVLSLIAIVRSLNLRTDFRDVLIEGARIAGLWAIVGELEGRGARTESPVPVAAPTLAQEGPPRVWPPQSEVETLWRSCGPVGADDEACAYLSGRALDPDRVDSLELGRILPATSVLPRWTATRLGNWREAGYRLIVPMVDPDGVLRSVRAWRIRDGEGPKRLPPSGHKASELVMADTFGRAMLAGERAPMTVCIVEGESDFFARCLVTHDPDVAVLGVISGSWSARFAERLPLGSRVSVRTDADQAGNRYAAEIIQSTRRRCFPFRVSVKT